MNLFRRILRTITFVTLVGKPGTEHLLLALNADAMKVSALSRISEWISIQDIASAFENRPNEGRIGMIALWGCNTNGMAQQLTKFADVVVVLGGDQSSAGSGYVAEEKLPGIIRKKL